MDSSTRRDPLGLGLLLGVVALICAGCSDGGGEAAGGGSCPETPCPRGMYCAVDEAGAGECLRSLGDAEAPPSERDQAAPEWPADASATDAAAGDGARGEAGADPADGAGLRPDQGGEACPEVRRLLKPVDGNISRVMLVVDRSYSMVQDEDRWTPMAETLVELARALDGGIRFGLTMFPNPDRTRVDDPASAAQACDPGRVLLEPAHDSAAEIERWFADARPAFGLGTPTAEALEAAGEALARAPTPNDFILLATDGGPGCNLALDDQSCVCLVPASCRNFAQPQSCLDDERTVRVIEGLARRGVRTVVLGITIGLPDEVRNNCPADWACLAGQACEAGACFDRIGPTLDAMAQAGGASPDGAYLEVGHLDELRAALRAAAGSFAPCVYELGELAAHGDRLRVTIDGEVVPPDADDGWTVADGALEFSGAACRALRDGSAHEILATCE